jgi:predicted permease
MWCWRRKELERDLERELLSDLELEAAEHEADGLPPEEARRAAQRAFGNATSIKEEIREMSPWTVLDRLAQDLRYGWRALGRNRGFATVAILTLALGIGVNTAIFSVWDAVDLRRLPVRDPQQLVMLEWSANAKWQDHGSSGFGGCDADRLHAAYADCSFSYPAFQYFQSKSKSVSGLLALAGPAGVQARIRGEIVPASALFVSGNFFQLLGVPAQLGRTIEESDDRAGAAPAAVLSFRYWEAHFQSDPGVLGKTIALEGSPFTVVGIASRDFIGLNPSSAPDLYIAVQTGSRLGNDWWSSLGADNRWLYLIGRLRDGVGPEQARAEFDVLLLQAPGVREAFSRGDRVSAALTNVGRGLSGLRRLYGDQLHVLMGVVALVLLIACANIANLLLTRASVRRREMAVRMAIGCSRARLLQQLLTESLLLAALGTAAGVVLALWGSRALAAFLTTRAGYHLQLEVRPDPLVLAFTAGIACLSAVLFGLAPALAATREQPGGALKTGTAASRRGLFGHALVAGEMTLALVLLVGAGLFVRTLVKLETADAGFRRDHLLTLRVERPHDAIARPAGQPLNPNLRERFAALPSVLSATWASDLPLVGNLETTEIRLDGRDELGEIGVNVLHVGPRFFETMGLPVLAGRSVRADDCRPDARVIWINRRLAAQYGPNVDPVGRFVWEGKTRFQIAGVVGDAKYQTMRSDIDPGVYRPSAGGEVFILRTASDPMALARAAREAVREVDPNLMVEELKSEAAQVDEQLFTEHLMARLSVVFGALALVMAAVGIYGVLAFSVTRRTAEIAIRMSLGGMPGEILWLVLRGGMAPAVAGAAAGLLASWGVTRLIATFLFGVSALDGLTFAAATLALLTVALGACYIPARRATRISPVVALRYE